MLEKIRGYRTYIVALGGVVIAAVGYLFGPIDTLGGLTIPAVDFDTFSKVSWEALMIVFLRKGVASVKPK